MPDYFVPIDTTRFTKYHRQLRDKGIILQANLKFIEKNRKAWQSKYNKFEDFVKSLK